MTKARSSKNRSRPRRGVTKRDLAKLLRQARELKENLGGFRETARGVAEALDRIVPSCEVEAMETTRADLLGTLEEMVNVTLAEADRHLGDIEALLAGENLDSGEWLGHGTRDRMDERALA
jgi:hypothetical protein